MFSADLDEHTGNGKHNRECFKRTHGDAHVVLVHIIKGATGHVEHML